GGGTLTLSASMQSPLKTILVLRVENGKGSYRMVESLRPGATMRDIIPSMDSAKPLDEFTRAAADALAARLEESGLFEKEARAMVNTWRASYFRSDGIRVLYILPQAWTDTFIPMHLYPKPRKLVRVMVGRTELLTADREA